MKIKLSVYLIFSIILITLSSVNNWSYLPLGGTFFWWLVYAGVLLAFIKLRKFFYNPINNKNIWIIKLYLFWNIICIIRGVFIADNYWEWKNLISKGMVLLLPLSIFISTNKIIVQDVFRVYIKYAIPAFLLFIPFVFSDGYGQYLAPIILLLLWFPLLPKKWKFIIIVFTLFIFIAGQSARSNFIKFSISLLLGLVYYMRIFIPKIFYSGGRLFLISAPLIFLVLAITGILNIFKLNEYIEGDYKSVEVIDGVKVEKSLTNDTRTFLYAEVLGSALKHNYVVFGRTPARGNDSNAFGLHLLKELKTGKKERFANEVSILNIFTWTGLIGVILYFLIFLKASYLAVNKSNSYFMKILGLFIAFRWSYAFIEDFSNFNLYYIFLWIMIGMCFSKDFRDMNDDEIKNWMTRIFFKKI